jgi:hypothetical protein
MSMMSSQEIRKRLEGYKIKYLEEQTGIHYNTIRRFILGSDSKASTVDKLAEWLEGKNNEQK